MWDPRAVATWDERQGLWGAQRTFFGKLGRKREGSAVFQVRKEMTILSSRSIGTKYRHDDHILTKDGRPGSLRGETCCKLSCASTGPCSYRHKQDPQKRISHHALESQTVTGAPKAATCSRSHTTKMRRSTPASKEQKRRPGTAVAHITSMSSGVALPKTPWGSLPKVRHLSLGMLVRLV